MRNVRPPSLLLLLIVLAAAVVWLRIASPGEDRRTLAGILNVRLPPGVQDIECRSYGFTDVLATCSFSMNGGAFPNLMEGWEFATAPCRSNSSHELTGGPNIGPVFAVHVCYRATPAEFEHGGSVFVAVNEQGTLGIADLYIE